MGGVLNIAIAPVYRVVALAVGLIGCGADVGMVDVTRLQTTYGDEVTLRALLEGRHDWRELQSGRDVWPR
ncbi:hypothetical protein [Hoyosella sp. YIM 151337]|uniref:hypothetical protein n=1 Tax=Hoyosella sp. YIM 151337 TaxID=2992742 RepID=UPI002235CEE1|nr:hypothetical protein [Hoyosella sp. YIM 151337]